MARKFTFFLVFFILSSLSWAANEEEKKEKPQPLPNALISKCLTYLDIPDFANAPSTCLLWNKLSNDGKLWELIGKRIKNPRLLRLKNNTWKQKVENWWSPVAHVLDMQRWDPEEIESALLAEGALLKQRLLNNLTKKIVEKTKPKIIDGRALTAAFLAYYNIYMRAEWPMWQDSKAAATAVVSLVRDHSLRGIAMQGTYIRDAVGNYRLVEMCIPGIDDFNERDAHKIAADEAATPAIERTLKILKVRGDKAEEISDKLYSLYYLAYMSSDDNFSNFFMPEFLEIHKNLKNYWFRLKGSDQILSLIAENTWRKENTAFVQDYLALKNFLEGISENIPQPKSGQCCSLQ